ncbi:MAG: glycosyltransferase [Bacteroidales bacterium]|nr:glycosyltransferase [Bacteroidales bacterium]
MIVYNQEAYIEQALKGILMQKTNFLFEIIIGEDCSTDHTKQIIEKFATLYPDNIKPFYHPENIGMMRNFTHTLNRCEGEYIAICEGDDYWIDEYKLAKQIEVLDANRDIMLSFHNTKCINSRKKRIYNSNDGEADGSVFTIEDLLTRKWFIMTASIVFRNVFKDSYPNWFKRIRNGDMALELMLADKGNFIYTDKVMAVYRQHIHGASVSSLRIKRNRALVKLLKLFNKHTGEEYNSLILKRIRQFNWELINMFKRKVKNSIPV